MQAPQQPAPITPTVIATGGSAAPIISKVSSDVINAATKERLRAADELLRRRIGALADAGLRDALLARLDKDQDVIQQAGIDRLNDARDKDLLDPGEEKNKGLNARQEATKKLFASQLTGNADAAAINEALDAMSQIRAGLFQKHLQEVERKSHERGYDLFNEYMGRSRPKEVTARTPGQPRPPIDLRKDLGQNSTVTHPQDDKRKIEFQPDGNSAKSEDPYALGLGMVADGKKDIIFGGHPEKALMAAEVALNAGAEDVDLEPETKDLMYVSSGLYDNFEKTKELRDRYDRLRQRVAAMKFARLNSANPVFNDKVTESRQHAEIFGKITTDAGRKDYLVTLNDDQKARLALELRDLNSGLPEADKPIYRLGEIKLDEYNYITKLLASVNGPRWAQLLPQGFRDAYSRIQTEPQQLAAFRALTQPYEAADFIAQIKDSEARARFYAEIENMNGDSAFKNEVRAACLGALVERRYNIASNDPKSTLEDYKLTATNADPNEINEILRGKSHADIEHIRELYLNKYDRLAIKVGLFQAEYASRALPADRAAPRSITYQPAKGVCKLPTDGLPSFYGKEERNPRDGNPKPRTMALTSEENVSRYLSFSKIVNERIDHLANHQQDVLPAKVAPRPDRLEFSPDELAAGGGGPGKSR